MLLKKSLSLVKSKRQQMRFSEHASFSFSGRVLKRKCCMRLPEQKRMRKCR